MYVQNPYGSDANVSTSLRELSRSLRDMVKDEMTARVRDREYQSRLADRQMQLKILGLDSDKLALQEKLALRKLDLQGDRDQLTAARDDRRFRLSEQTANIAQQDRAAQLALQQQMYDEGEDQRAAKLKATEQQTMLNKPTTVAEFWDFDEQQDQGIIKTLATRGLTGSMTNGQIREAIRKDPVIPVLLMMHGLTKGMPLLKKQYKNADAEGKLQIREGVRQQTQELRAIQNKISPDKIMAVAKTLAADPMVGDPLKKAMQMAALIKEWNVDKRIKDIEKFFGLNKEKAKPQVKSDTKTAPPKTVDPAAARQELAALVEQANALGVSYGIGTIRNLVNQGKMDTAIKTMKRMINQKKR